MTRIQRNHEERVLYHLGKIGEISFKRTLSLYQSGELAFDRFIRKALASYKANKKARLQKALSKMQ